MKTFGELKDGDTVFYAELLKTGKVKIYNKKVSIIPSGNGNQYIGVQFGKNVLDKKTLEKKQHTVIYDGDVWLKHVISTNKKSLLEGLIKLLKRKIKVENVKLHCMESIVLNLNKSLEKAKISL